MNKCPFNHPVRSDLPPLTQRIASLPVDERGYPIPWFVAWPNGKPDFRVMDPQKLVAAHLQKLCWVCGQRLRGDKTFVIGPMCAVNRISSEPPSHLDCAEWSVKGCPFLSKPNMTRRQHDELIKAGATAPGIAIERNPGVMLLWSTKSYERFEDGMGRGGKLFRLGDPVTVSWWREGRPATRQECVESIETGMPALAGGCRTKQDVEKLAGMADRAALLLPEL